MTKLRVPIAVLGPCAAVLVAVTVISCGGSDQGGLHLVEVGQGFKEPVHVATAPGDPNRLYVVEQGGIVKTIDDPESEPTDFLDIHKLVRAGGEQGLLSIAFHPDYKKNHLFYVYYTAKSGNNKIAEFKASSPTHAAESSRSTVLTFQHPKFDFHNGGQLQFGPDGYLWAGTGDGGGTGDEFDNARNPDRLLGKLIRIDPVADGSGDYRIPPDNPYVDRPGRDEVYAYGLRNPFRFSFERGGEAIAIGDVGQFKQEEIDYASIKDAKGANFGWPEFEGTDRYSNRAGADPPVKPIAIYRHTDKDLEAVTGGYVVTDPDLPSLKGRYVYADFYEGIIRSLIPKASGGTHERRYNDLEVPSPSSFGEGPNGEIYVTSYSKGRVFQIVED